MRAAAQEVPANPALRATTHAKWRRRFALPYSSVQRSSVRLLENRRGFRCSPAANRAGRCDGDLLHDSRSSRSHIAPWDLLGSYALLRPRRSSSSPTFPASPASSRRSSATTERYRRRCCKTANPRCTPCHSRAPVQIPSRNGGTSAKARALATNHRSTSSTSRQPAQKYFSARTPRSFRRSRAR